jgi:hypothetical protein
MDHYPVKPGFEGRIPLKSLQGEIDLKENLLKQVFVIPVRPCYFIDKIVGIRTIHVEDFFERKLITRLTFLKKLFCGLQKGFIHKNPLYLLKK